MNFAAPHELQAGPVRCTLEAGELRSVYLGQREIIRRLYFCVRFHDKWDTAANEITACEVEAGPHSFSVRVAARATIGPVDYGWTAIITGSSDGTVSFAVSGAALSPCTQIRRAGLQLLLGAASVIGQPLSLIRPDGSLRRLELPVRLDPEVMPMQFQALRYTTREGVDVSAEFDGTLCGYEDQRNFNDSSFKFFSAHHHTYPTLETGAAAASTVTIRLANVPQTLPVPSRLGAYVRDVTGGARIPRIVASGTGTSLQLFYPLNKSRGEQAHNKVHAWGFTPAVNLYDDDTFMENTAAVLDQLRTARVFTSPHGADIACRLDPVHFESLHPRPAPDARNHTAFAAAWCAAFTRYAAMGGAWEIAFRLGPGAVDAVRSVLAGHAGKLVRTVDVIAPGRSPAEAFGIEISNDRCELWFINCSARSLTLPIYDLAESSYDVRRIGATAQWENDPQLKTSEDSTSLRLAAWEIVVLQPRSQN